MNTTVITATALDLGAGPQETATFAGCTWHVDDVGALHIVRENRQGNLAAFAPGAWTLVCEGSVVVARAS